MYQHSFLKGQRVVTPDGPGEVIKIVGNDVTVKLDGGNNQTYPSDTVQDDSDAG